MAGRADFVVTGHRGAMALQSENTIASFLLARALGADEIEFDIRQTADGVLVVHHDENLGRVVNGAGPVRSHTWAELSRLRVHGRHRIPQLDEVLALTGIGFQLELKDPLDAQRVTDTLAGRSLPNERILITSFHASALQPALEASLRTGLICGPGDVGSLALANELGVDQVLAHWSVVAHRDTRRFADNGGTVTVWPSADGRMTSRAMTAGYGGTTCDDPSVAVAARNSLAA